LNDRNKAYPHRRAARLRENDNGSEAGRRNLKFWNGVPSLLEWSTDNPIPIGDDLHLGQAVASSIAREADMLR